MRDAAAYTLALWLAAGVWLTLAWQCCAAHARQPDDTAHLLAIAFVSEAGWQRDTLASRDYRAIYHVLRRRSERTGRDFPAMLRAYVSALSGKVAGPRVRWLLALPVVGDAAPDGWPHDRASWERHALLWRAARSMAAACLAGDCADPYPAAIHWGGPMDAPRECMRRLPDQGTRNRFYRLDTACSRTLSAAVASGRVASK